MSKYKYKKGDKIVYRDGLVGEVVEYLPAERNPEKRLSYLTAYQILRRKDGEPFGKLKITYCDPDDVVPVDKFQEKEYGVEHKVLPKDTASIFLGEQLGDILIYPVLKKKAQVNLGKLQGTVLDVRLEKNEFIYKVKVTFANGTKSIVEIPESDLMDDI